jgi:pyrimidine operon attenuation protein/uracil phosphoribosyltransferase
MPGERESANTNAPERVVMDAAALNEAFERLASEIVERTKDFDGRIALVGVRTRGVPISRRLAELVAARRPGSAPIELGALDITLYRDDMAVASQPIVRSTELPFRVDDTWIVLVDDVLFTGRTTRAAIAALIDYGRPRKIELLVLVDRGGRELPIHADYIGLVLETRSDETVRVRLQEQDGRDQVVLAPSPSTPTHRA